MRLRTCSVRDNDSALGDSRGWKKRSVPSSMRSIETIAGKLAFAKRFCMASTNFRLNREGNALRLILRSPGTAGYVE